MDGIANVARQQQTQVNVGETQQKMSQQVQEAPKVDIIKQMQEATTTTKINSKEQVEALVSELNAAMAPMNTNLKFGVDNDDVFFVSVIESETSKILRRFPAEQAAAILPKMQEVTGVLFDSKG